MKILLLEDDEIINESVKDYFEIKGHIVDSYLDGEELLNSVCATAYDIFLLDICTPTTDGFDVLEELRRSAKDTPAIFITALSDIENVEKGYALGCNDYVKKPFILKELELRVNKLVMFDIDKSIKVDNFYSFDKSSMQLWYNDSEVELSKNEILIVNILVSNINVTVDSESIIEYVWDYKDISQNTLRTQMKKLRQKLHSDFIKNIRGRGYKIESS